MMSFIKFRPIIQLTFVAGLLFLGACSNDDQSSSQQGIEIKVLVGSALKHFCEDSATTFNQQRPKLDSGERFYMSCEAQGSGDVVATMVSLAQKLQQGSIKPEDPKFPTLLSVDGEIYHAQLIYRINQLFPGQDYIPQITDSPLLAYSPMIFMTSSELAPGLRQQQDLYQKLVKAKTHKEIDSNSPNLPINFVHTAPTRSNSGLQTLVTQFASVSGKRPEELTLADVQKYQGQVRDIQSKITRYGVSTGTLANDMVKNGVFWASIGSVYESSVIEANSQPQSNQTRYEAVYPQSTFTSNMRAILPNAPWVSEQEKEGARKIIEYLRSPNAQKQAAELGLRPGVPGVDLGNKFVAQYGVNSDAKYDSLRPPKPEVVDAMVKSWQEFAKKPSQVVIVVDSSGSMAGDKLPGVQNTLRYYIESLGPKEKIALIDFDSQIRSPVIIDGTPQGKEKGLQFINSLEAEGATLLYDAALLARNWLQQNRRPDAINGVIILTDGEDSGSRISLNRLQQELEKSGFKSDERIAFFTIGYGNKNDFNPDVLKKMAELNGGYYREGDPQTITTLMSDLQLEF